MSLEVAGLYFIHKMSADVLHQLVNLVGERGLDDAVPGVALSVSLEHARQPAQDNGSSSDSGCICHQLCEYLSTCMSISPLV